MAKKSGEKKVAKKVEKYGAILDFVVPDTWYRASELEDVVDVKESRKVLLKDMIEQGLIESTDMLYVSGYLNVYNESGYELYNFKSVTDSDGTQLEDKQSI